MKNKQFKNQNVKNKKVKRYAKWFEFAQKTRDENNQKEDFDVYVKDDIFTEMIRKLSHKSLDAEDLSFIEYYRLLEGQRDVWESQYKEEGKQIGLEEAQQQIKQAESKAQQAENKAQQTQDQAIIAMIQNTTLTDEAIATALGVPIKRVQELRKKTK